MTKFWAYNIKWNDADTHTTLSELPTALSVEADEEDDVVEILSKEYNSNILSLSTRLDSCRVVKQWAQNFNKVVVHSDITREEAVDICSSADTHGEDKAGPWAYVWYWN